MLIDVHAHLTDERFAGERGEVLARASQAGLVAVIDTGCDLDSSEAALAAARVQAAQAGEASPRLFTTAGFHPHEAKLVAAGSLDRLRQMAQDPLVVAIGEIGLDYHYDFSPREVQREVFRDQLALAAELEMPVVVHDREAHADTLAILREATAGRCVGVMHCYSGSAESAPEYLEMGFYLSIGGPLTFNNARRVVEVVERVPLDRLLLETDCPYLAPVPRRGERNEPANVALVAARVAEIKGLPVAEVERATTANAIRLFGLPETLLEV
jgi:TatD DNase family protein